VSIPVVILDTGPLTALFNANGPEHSACQAALAQCGHAVISPLVLAEADYLITSRVGQEAAFAALDYIARKAALGRFEVPEVGPHLYSARAVMQTYAGLDIGLTDAMNVVLAREFRTNALATLDRKHARAIRPLTAHEAFLLLPDDLS
jgi:predicted nucleic acid-binding protein